MHNSGKFLVAALCCGVMTVTASATLLLNDNFDRADGSLVGTTPTPGPGADWANHSGTLGDLLISGGQAVVQHGAPSEDANVSFATYTSGLLTANFDLTVSDDTVIGASGTDFEYFAHFFTAGSFNFRSRIDVVAPNAAGDYTLGIATSASTAEATFATDFTYGVPINVNLTFDFDAGLSTVTVGGTTITSTSVVAGESLNAFGFRQSDSSNNETIMVDNLMVTHVPEPSTFALLGLGGLIAFLRRRTRG